MAKGMQYVLSVDDRGSASVQKVANAMIQLDTNTRQSSVGLQIHDLASQGLERTFLKLSARLASVAALVYEVHAGMAELATSESELGRDASQLLSVSTDLAHIFQEALATGILKLSQRYIGLAEDVHALHAATASGQAQEELGLYLTQLTTRMLKERGDEQHRLGVEIVEDTQKMNALRTATEAYVASGLAQEALGHHLVAVAMKEQEAAAKRLSDAQGILKDLAAKETEAQLTRGGPSDALSRIRQAGFGGAAGTSLEGLQGLIKTTEGLQGADEADKARLLRDLTESLKLRAGGVVQAGGQRPASEVFGPGQLANPGESGPGQDNIQALLAKGVQKGVTINLTVNGSLADAGALKQLIYDSLMPKMNEFILSQAGVQ